ncbi:MAG: hypothetical protein HYU99_02585 [Deltaproteobacteria bacterium]|nr:hypothetical protein [Deltaproteobacteria bacterium]
MTNQQLGAGKDVLSWCGKCKLTLAHVIVSMKDATTIGKCQCKTCFAEHNYRDPETAGKKKPSKKTARKETVPVRRSWQEAVAGAQGTLKAYSTDKTFKEGELIDHPSFGKGIVERLVPGDKMQTLFEDGVKLLICSR